MVLARAESEGRILITDDKDFGQLVFRLSRPTSGVILKTKTEEITVDKKTLRRMVEFMEEAIREGLTREETTSQVDLMLDKAAQKRLNQSLKEVKDGRVRHFNNPEELIKGLHASFRLIEVAPAGGDHGHFSTQLQQAGLRGTTTCRSSSAGTLDR